MLLKLPALAFFYLLFFITIIRVKGILAIGTFSTSRRVGGPDSYRDSEVCAGKRVAALNFLDFFVSFCVKTKMKSKPDYIQKYLQVGAAF